MNETSLRYVIALYIRLSIEDSKVESMSIESQKRILHQYADQMEGVRNAEVLEFVDNGYTGTNFERPAMQELLEQVRAGKVNCIIVKDFSRFGRNSIEVGYFMERVFPLYGVRFISLGNDFDSDRLHGDTGGIGMAFSYLVAEFYSRDMSVKSKSAKYIKMQRGEYQSVICPYGYRKSADGRMEPDEETAPNVQFIFELARSGCGTTEIIQALFDRGVPTPGEHKAAKGLNYHNVSRCHKIWQRNTVLNILNDQRYTGMYVIGRRKVVEVGSTHVRMKDESEWFKIPDHHPAIVSQEVFEQVQAQRLRFRSVKRHTTDFPLRGKVYCGCCGHTLKRRATKKPAFRCEHTKVDAAAPCHGLTLPEADLEAMLYEILSKQAQVILNLENLSNAGLLDVHLAEQAEHRRQIQNCQDEKRRLYERLVLQEIPVEEYRAQKAVVDAELARLNQVYTAASAQAAQMKLDGEARQARHKLAQEITSSNGLTKGLADALIERVLVYPGNQIEVCWKMKDFCIEE